MTETNYPKSEILLFGSRARGDANENSDWDLLFLVNNDALNVDTEIEIINSLYEIELELGIVLSPVIFSKKEWETKHSSTLLYENVIKDRIRIS